MIQEKNLEQLSCLDTQELQKGDPNLAWLTGVFNSTRGENRLVKGENVWGMQQL